MKTLSSFAISKDIFNKSVQSVQPRNLIAKCIKVENRHLLVNGDKYPISKPCYVVGFGKAVAGMAVEMEKVLGPDLQRAIVTVPKGIFDGFKCVDTKIEFIEGAANNLPDEDAMKGASEIRYLVENLTEDDMLIVLISGGGSALLPLPIPPITLQEKHCLIRDLARKGADIVELNCVRKQISLLKGGGLAALAYPCKVISLILSDIVGDPLDFIASGPTTPNINTTDDAINIIQKYFLYDKLPDSIKFVLQKKNQFPKAVTPISNGEFEHVVNYIIGNNKIAAQSAKHHASLTYGFQSAVISTEVNGDVDKISKIYVDLAREISSVITDPFNKHNLKLFLDGVRSDLRLSDDCIKEIVSMDFSRNICLIFAGEPTVVVKGNGRGGRNQQLALAFSIEVNKQRIETANISFLSCGTDGIDGPTDAAGAIGTSDLFDNSLVENIKPNDYLDNNDSYGFFELYNNGSNLVKIGHTGTNVMDIHIMLIEPRKL